MGIQVRLDGESEKLLKKLRSMENIDFKGVLNAIGEGLRTSVMERFDRGESPEGQKWKPSIRAEEAGGKTLVKTAALKSSIHLKSDGRGLAVGTNDIRAATHQFGDTRTIKAKKGKYLRFQVAGNWRSVKSVTVHIPARPFLGISEDDGNEIREILESALED